MIITFSMYVWGDRVFNVTWWTDGPLSNRCQELSPPTLATVLPPQYHRLEEKHFLIKILFFSHSQIKISTKQSSINFSKRDPWSWPARHHLLYYYLFSFFYWSGSRNNDDLKIFPTTISTIYTGLCTLFRKNNTRDDGRYGFQVSFQKRPPSFIHIDIYLPLDVEESISQSRICTS